MRGLLPELRFVKNLGQLLSGNMVAQLLPLIFTPFLTRFYSPTDFREWGIFISVLAIAIVFATARLDTAMVVPKQQEEAEKLGMALVVLSTLVGLITFGVCLYWQPSWMGVAAGRSAWLAALATGLALWFGALRQSLSYWFYRDQLFGAVSLMSLIRAAVFVGVALTWGNLPQVSVWVNGLFAASVFSELASLLYGVPILARRVNMRSLPPWHTVWPTVLQFRHFSSWGVPGDLLNALTNQFLPLILLDHYYGTIAVGQFVMARRVIYMPMALLSRTTGDVFVAHASEEIRTNGDCRKLFLTTFVLLTITSAPIFGLLAYLAPWLFPWALGAEWADAGVLAQPLTLCAGTAFVVSTLARILQVTGFQRLDFLWQILLFVVLTSTLVIVSRSGATIDRFYQAFAIAYTLCYGFYLAISYSVSRLPIERFTVESASGTPAAVE